MLCNHITAFLEVINSYFQSTESNTANLAECEIFSVYENASSRVRNAERDRQLDSSVNGQNRWSD